MMIVLFILGLLCVATVYCFYMLRWFRRLRKAMLSAKDDNYATINIQRALSDIEKLSRWPLLQSVDRKLVQAIIKNLNGLIQIGIAQESAEATIDKLRQEDAEQP